MDLSMFDHGREVLANESLLVPISQEDRQLLETQWLPGTKVKNEFSELLTPGSGPGRGKALAKSRWKLLPQGMGLISPGIRLCLVWIR